MATPPFLRIISPGVALASDGVGAAQKRMQMRETQEQQLLGLCAAEMG